MTHAQEYKELFQLDCSIYTTFEVRHIASYLKLHAQALPAYKKRKEKQGFQELSEHLLLRNSKTDKRLRLHSNTGQATQE